MPYIILPLLDPDVSANHPPDALRQRRSRSSFDQRRRALDNGLGACHRRIDGFLAL